MKIHQGESLPFPVLTNSTYEISSQTAESIIQDNKQTLPADNSLQRFVKTCQMLGRISEGDIPVPLTDYAFSILDHVSQGDFTKWSIVYDIKNKEILFKTSANRNSRKIRFEGFDFDCSLPSKMYDLEQEGAGDITSKFITADKMIRRRSLEKAIKESSEYVKIEDASRERILNYEDGVKCK